jgi:hypothetical protein
MQKFAAGKFHGVNPRASGKEPQFPVMGKADSNADVNFKAVFDR